MAFLLPGTLHRDHSSNFHGCNRSRSLGRIIVWLQCLALLPYDNIMLFMMYTKRCHSKNSHCIRRLPPQEALSTCLHHLVTSPLCWIQYVGCVCDYMTLYFYIKTFRAYAHNWKDVGRGSNSFTKRRSRLLSNIREEVHRVECERCQLLR